MGSSTLGYGQMGVLAEMSEAEVFNSMMRGHDSMMAVLTSRHRSLQIIYSLWQGKDLKVPTHTQQLIIISSRIYAVFKLNFCSSPPWILRSQ